MDVSDTAEGVADRKLPNRDSERKTILSKISPSLPSSKLPRDRARKSLASRESEAVPI